MTEAPTGQERFVRLPGLLRRWEIERVLEQGADYHIEGAGMSRDGTSLFAVYRREKDDPEIP
jgi:hypothetical protein